MKKVISISEILKGEGDTSDLQASGEGSYDEEKRQLEVCLALRDCGSGEQTLETQTVHLKVDFDEALPAAKDVFAGWVRRVVQIRKGLIPKH